MNKLKKIIGSFVFETCKGIRCFIDRKRLKNREFTILACNCVAGCMYHDLGLKFDSPTINLYIYPKDFINFLKKPQYYLKQEMECYH